MFTGSFRPGEVLKREPGQITDFRCLLQSELRYSGAASRAPHSKNWTARDFRGHQLPRRARNATRQATPTERDMTDQAKRPMFAADGVAAPLRHSAFRRIWLASLLSNLGLLIQAVGAAWAMTQMTPSADKVALVQTALMLPVMLIAMPAGAIADMYDRRIVALVSLSIALAGATALSVLAWLGRLTPEILLAFCFLFGSGLAAVWTALAGCRRGGGGPVNIAGPGCRERREPQHSR